MLVIDTQYKENYGSEEQPYWKFKGGSSYKVLGIPSNIDNAEVVELVRREVEHFDVFTEEYILGWTVQSDDWMSDFEKSQLEYEGEITYHEPTIDYAELNARYA